MTSAQLQKALDADPGALFSETPACPACQREVVREAPPEILARAAAEAARTPREVVGPAPAGIAPGIALSRCPHCQAQAFDAGWIGSCKSCGYMTTPQWWWQVGLLLALLAAVVGLERWGPRGLPLAITVIMCASMVPIVVWRLWRAWRERRKTGSHLSNSPQSGAG
jgi:hypothetical protein